MLTLLTSQWRTGFALQRELAEYGIEFEIDERVLPRIADDSLEACTRYQAEAGAEAIGGPVFVVAQGLRISALHDLPGPHHVFAEKLGAAAILRLLEGVSDRRAHLDRIVVYAKPGGTTMVFSGGTAGTITEHLDKGADPHNLEESLFIPEYRMLNQKQTRTLYVLAREEPALVQHAWGDALAQFGTWMQQQR